MSTKTIELVRELLRPTYVFSTINAVSEELLK